jgi:hypothetical protein
MKKILSFCLLLSFIFLSSFNTINDCKTNKGRNIITEITGTYNAHGYTVSGADLSLIFTTYVILQIDYNPATSQIKVWGYNADSSRVDITDKFTQSGNYRVRNINLSTIKCLGKGSYVLPNPNIDYYTLIPTRIAYGGPWYLGYSINAHITGTPSVQMRTIDPVPPGRMNFK